MFVEKHYAIIKRMCQSQPLQGNKEELKSILALIEEIEGICDENLPKPEEIKEETGE